MLKDILVVADMDGTLLNRQHELPNCNLETIRLFTSLGGNFTVATGRVTESVGRYTQLHEYMAPAITSGGCVIYDYKRSLVKKSELIPGAVARRAIQDILDTFPGTGTVVMAEDNRNYVVQNSPELQKLFDDEKISFSTRPTEEFPSRWNKVLFAGAPEHMDSIAEHVAGKYYPGAYFVRTALPYFEIMPEGVNKGSALRELCDIMKIPLANTYVIGDYYNDLDMMRAAGHAVAMDNAPEDVKAVAKEITGNCNDGGVGQFLYKLVKEYAKG